MTNPGSFRHRTAARIRGFTLIELLIVIAIIGILATIAVASYRGYIIKSRRQVAQACLTEVAQAMERHYTTALTYATAPAPSGACLVELNNIYAISFVSAPTASAYTIQAVPNTTVQNDTKCGTMSMDQRGATLPTTDGCW